MKKSHFASPCESAADVFARFATPWVDFGVPILAGRVRADVVEVAGNAQWLVGELCSHMVASVLSSVDCCASVVLLDVQHAHDLARTVALAKENMRGLTQEEIHTKLEQLRIIRCDSALHLLCALRQCEQIAEAHAGANKRRLIVFVDGMTNLFWPNKQTGKVCRGLDLLSACVKLMRQLSVKHNSTVVASKLVFFPRKGLFEDYFGNGWKSTCKVAIGVEEVRMTLTALGKTGTRAVGFLSDSEQPERRIGFQVSASGCSFGAGQ